MHYCCDLNYTSYLIYGDWFIYAGNVVLGKQCMFDCVLSILLTYYLVFFIL